MDVFTMQRGKWRQARNHDILIMDITVKSGFSIFAPTWDMVMGHKQGRISDEEYTKLYYDKMNASWKADRDKWIDTLKITEPVALTCYCREGAFCHRHLLKGMFEKLCERYDIPFLYYGELS